MTAAAAAEVASVEYQCSVALALASLLAGCLVHPSRIQEIPAAAAAAVEVVANHLLRLVIFVALLAVVLVAVADGEWQDSHLLQDGSASPRFWTGVENCGSR